MAAIAQKISEERVGKKRRREREDKDGLRMSMVAVGSSPRH